MVVVKRFDDTTTIVAGMRWEVSQAGMGRQEARSRAKGAGGQAYLLRASDKNLGHCTLPERAKGGVRYVSLAAGLADHLTDKAWCGVFEFGDDYVVVLAKGGIVLSGGDSIYSKKDDALSQFNTNREITEVSYAPAAWAIDGTGDTAALISAIDWPASPAIQPLGVKTKKPAVTILALVGVASAGVIGWQFWKDAELKREAEQASITPPPPPQPWLSKVRPYAGTLSCVGARGRMADLSRWGWSLKEIDCDIEQRKFKATLDNYTVLSKLPALASEYTIKLKDDGSGIVVDGPLYPASGSDRGNEKPSMASVLAARNAIYGSASKVGWQTTANKSQFNFEMTVNVEQMGTYLEHIPTLSFNRLQYDSGHWRIDGEIFAS